jgi:putative membrane protein
MQEIINMKYVAGAFIYSFIGIFILFISFWIAEKVTPEDLWEEILVKQNKALAIIAAAFIIAVSVIVASAIHG